jgi:Zn-dependent peptidase ImmA (M78 family)
MMNIVLLEKKADEFRQNLGLNAADSINLSGLLYNLDILTVFRPLGEKLSGMALKVGEGDEAKRFMLINIDHPLGKQNFTICHELYHLHIQQNFSSMMCVTGLFDRQEDPEEKYADIFASYLLIPTNGLKSNIPDNELAKNKICLSTILRIEHYFGCSRSALLFRLKQEAFIDNRTYTAFKADVIKGARERGYNTELYLPTSESKVIGDYGVIAKELFDRERISENHYFSYLLDLGMSPDEIEKIYNGEDSPVNSD